MILSDADIAARVDSDILISPFRPEQLQPASYDIRLANKFWIYAPGVGGDIDPRQSVRSRMVEHTVFEDGGEFRLGPGQFALAASQEWFAFPDDLAGRLEGRSSWGRLGLIIHSSAGFFDPGFKGTATLELSNLAPRPLILRSGDRIGQMSFLKLSRAAYNPYGGKYQNQADPTLSRIHEDAL